MATHSNHNGEEVISMENYENDLSLDVVAGPSSHYVKNTQTLRSEDSNGTEDEMDSILRRMPSKNSDIENRCSKSKDRKSQRGFSAGGYLTIRLKHGQEVDIDVLADQLVGQEDSVDGATILRVNENIRDMPTTLSNKKAIRHRVEGMRSSPKSTFKCCDVCTGSIAMSWQRFKANLAEVTYSLSLWKGHLKVIEGHFGTGVTSYFLFLKRLLLLNIIVFLLTLAFVIIPQIVFRWEQQTPPGYTQNISFSGWEFFTGGGWFSDTEMYYGYYYDAVITVLSGSAYDMRYAYLCTCGGYYLLTVIILASILSSSYKQNYISASNEYSFYYVSKVFCGWDYSVTNNDAAELKSKSIFKELQEYLSTFKKDKKSRTCIEWCGVTIFRLFTNLIVLGLLAGSGYLMWYISITQSLTNDVGILSDLAMPLCISAINVFLPFAFTILASFEKYRNPRAELTITMLRTIVLNAVTIGVLIYFWFNSVDCSQRNLEEQEWLDSEMTCYPCWENFMGEQIYRLVIVDFVFILLITFLSEFIRRLMSQFCCPSLSFPEFNIARNTLNLIYSQALVWLGTFYSPVLSFIMILKVIVIFYVKRVSVVSNCVPSVKAWRAGQTSTLIQALLFVTFILCFVAVAYGIVFLQPSQVCGPYKGYNHSYNVIGDLLGQWQATGAGHVVKGLIEIFTSTAFLAFLVITLIVISYYAKVISSSHNAMVALLRSQIVLEGKDRAFLLRLLQEASKRAAMKGPVRRPLASAGVSGHVMPVPESGKQFSKAKMAAAVNLKDSAHRKHKADPGGGLTNALSPKTFVNPMYAARSLERDEPNLSDNPVAVESEDHVAMATEDPVSAENPAFVSHSPQSKPKLPYPNKHYMYPNDNHDSNDE